MTAPTPSPSPMEAQRPMQGLPEFLRVLAVSFERAASPDGANTARQWASEVEAAQQGQPASAVAVQPGELRLEWRDGIPPRPWNQEWFIAETIHRERVVLRSLPAEWAYHYTTADGTYMVAKKIRRWMQFPDSDYIAPEAAPSDEARLLRALVSAQRKLEATHDAEAMGTPAERLAAEEANTEAWRQAEAFYHPATAPLPPPSAPQPVAWRVRATDPIGPLPWRFVDAQYHVQRPDLYEEEPLYTGPATGVRGAMEKALAALEEEAAAYEPDRLAHIDEAIAGLRAVLADSVQQPDGAKR